MSPTSRDKVLRSKVAVVRVTRGIIPRPDLQLAGNDIPHAWQGYPTAGLRGEPVIGQQENQAGQEQQVSERVFPMFRGLSHNERYVKDSQS